MLARVAESALITQSTVTFCAKPSYNLTRFPCHLRLASQTGAVGKEKKKRAKSSTPMVRLSALRRGYMEVRDVAQAAVGAVATLARAVCASVSGCTSVARAGYGVLWHRYFF